MARPRKTAKDLVPDESPLEEIVAAEEAVDEEPLDEASSASDREVEPDAASAPEGEAEVASETEGVEAEAAPEADADAEPEAEPQAAPEGQAEAEPDAQAEPEVAAEVADEPVAAEDDAAAAADEPVADVAEPEPDPAPAAAAAPAKPKRTKAEKRARKAARSAKAKPQKPAGERKPIVRLPKPEHERGRRKERRGVVVSNAMDKTIVVRVDSVKPDRRYKKVVRRSTKLHAHDAENSANIGDVVRIVETRPLSKTKNWRLAEITEKAR